MKDTILVRLGLESFHFAFPGAKIARLFLVPEIPLYQEWYVPFEVVEEPKEPSETEIKMARAIASIDNLADSED